MGTPGLRFGGCQLHCLLSVPEKPVSSSQEEVVAVAVLPQQQVPQELVLLTLAIRAPELTISLQLMSKDSRNSVN